MRDKKRVWPDGRMTVDATADYLDVSTWTLIKWRMEGRGPKYYKRGRRVFYYQADLDNWLKGA